LRARQSGDPMRAVRFAFPAVSSPAAASLAILRLDLAKPGYLMHFGRLFYELEASEVAQPWFKGPSIQPPVAVGGHSRLRLRVFHVKRDMRVCRLSRDGMLVHRAASEG
jgi:hypothetical protein